MGFCSFGKIFNSKTLTESFSSTYLSLSLFNKKAFLNMFIVKLRLCKVLFTKVAVNAMLLEK